MTQLVNGVRLQYFHPREFIRPALDGGQQVDWSNQMDRRLLVLLDALRHAWGNAIRISNGSGALGRYGGQSRHAVDTWGTVMAADMVPAGTHTIADAKRFFHLAKAVGVGGIGFYPGWNQGPGWHIDSRINPLNPTTWGMVDGKYTTLGDAFAAFDARTR